MMKKYQVVTTTDNKFLGLNVTVVEEEKVVSLPEHFFEYTKLEQLSADGKEVRVSSSNYVMDLKEI